MNFIFILRHVFQDISCICTPIHSVSCFTFILMTTETQELGNFCKHFLEYQLQTSKQKKPKNMCTGIKVMANYLATNQREIQIR